VGIDYRGLSIFIARQFQSCSNIVSTLKQMHGKGMPEGLARYTRGQSCQRDAVPYLLSCLFCLKPSLEML